MLPQIFNRTIRFNFPNLRLHGCALLQYLHECSLHGNKQIAEAVEMYVSVLN